jgi:TRAP-type C4-dicarboxylate transport system substrate-binding protein
MPLDFMYNYQLMEACKYLTNTHHVMYTQFKLINEDAWQKLPAEYQELLTKTFEEGRKRSDAGNSESIGRLERDMKEKYNVQFIELDTGTREEMEKIATRVVEENIGVMFDQARYDDFQAALKEYRSKKNK